MNKDTTTTTTTTTTKDKRAYRPAVPTSARLSGIQDSIALASRLVADLAAEASQAGDKELLNSLYAMHARLCKEHSAGYALWKKCRAAERAEREED